MKRPQLVGIVNVTPDSFSGDGVASEAALLRAISQIDAGAEILDIGAESTRPGATMLGAEEEWTRLEPVLASLMPRISHYSVQVSVDTRHAATAARALALGVHIINDVGGLRDPSMISTLARAACDIVVMHALTLPADTAVTLPCDADPVRVLLEWKADLLARLELSGIAASRVICDPGIGFGKTPQQSLALILQAEALVSQGGRWFFGHSRKSFLSLFSDVPSHERDTLTRAFSAFLANAKVDYLRVHDVAGHRRLMDTLCM